MQYKNIWKTWLLLLLPLLFLPACNGNSGPTFVSVPSPTPSPISGGGPTRIAQIQGASQTSPLEGQAVSNVPGIVTAVATAGVSHGAGAVNRVFGFWIQDPNPDSNPATSEGIFVDTGAAAPSNLPVGAAVVVSGTVSEFAITGRPNDLSITEIGSPASPATFRVVSTGNPLPSVTILGNGGRIPPSEVIDGDGLTMFNPTSDGIDFFESLEGMRVQVNDAVAVSPDGFDIAVVGDNGVNAGPRTARGGLNIAPGSFNPERILVDIEGTPTLPRTNVGDRFSSPIVGVIDYTFSNFKLLTESLPTPGSGGLQRETTTLLPGPNLLTVGDFNVENLSVPGSASTTPERFQATARSIVSNLGSPDILNLSEIQDNSSTINDGTVDASQVLNALIAAIRSAGGPTYEFRQINPENNRDGGAPGGNIRVAFLFNPARVQFVDRPGGTATALVGITTGDDGFPQLSFSPGRLVDPPDGVPNSAFTASRKPLVGEFRFNGQKVFVIGNHFNSKGGDQPLFGRFQPPTLTTEPQRIRQATIVRDFVSNILRADNNARVIVLGDLNDFEFSNPIAILRQGSLNVLMDTLPSNERYTFIFEGNSQVLDHILVSPSLSRQLDGFDIVHINAEFGDNTSDHDPSVARFRF